MLEERQTPEERDMVTQRERGYGPTSALASLRLFDAPEGTGGYIDIHARRYKQYCSATQLCKSLALPRVEPNDTRGVRTGVLLGM